MFFSKKSGFHCLVLFLNNETQQPLHIVMPQEVASDVIATMRKFEKSHLNHEQYLGKLGSFIIIQDIQNFSKIEIYNDTLSWSEPTLYTDYAKLITEKLQTLFSEEESDMDSSELEEELVYFIGEFTMMQDNGFVAPF